MAIAYLGFAHGLAALPHILQRFGNLAGNMAIAAFERFAQDVAIAQTRAPFVIPNGMKPAGNWRPVPMSFSISDRFSIKLVVSFLTLSSTDVPRNVLRVTDPSREQCKPCIFYTPTAASRTGRFDLLFEGGGVVSNASVSVSNLLTLEYARLEASLEDRVLALETFRGTDRTQPTGSKAVVHTAAFPTHEDCLLYVGYGIYKIKGSFDPRITVDRTLMGGARAYFRISTSTIVPNLLTANGTTATTLVPANGHALFNQMYSSSPSISTDGPGPGTKSVCFDGSSALVHSVTDERFVMGAFNRHLSTCAWVKRTDPIDTLFTTFVDGAHQLRLYAFYQDVSLLSHGSNAIDVRADPPARANLELNAWHHVCGAASLEGPARLWVDGHLVSNQNQNAVTAPSDATRPLAVGGSSNLDLYSTWSLDRGARACMSEVVVFGRLLTNSDVERIRQAGISGTSLLEI